MFSEVMEFFGLEKELDHLGFFETTSQKHLAKELKLAIAQGRLIALSGVVGSGKTTFLQKMMAELTKSQEVVVSRSLAVESDKVRLVTLITALFYLAARGRQRAEGRRQKVGLSVEQPYCLSSLWV